MPYSNPAAEKYIREHPENTAYAKAYEEKVRASYPEGEVEWSPKRKATDLNPIVPEETTPKSLASKVGERAMAALGGAIDAPTVGLGSRVLPALADRIASGERELLPALKGTFLEGPMSMLAGLDTKFAPAPDVLTAPMAAHPGYALAGGIAGGLSVPGIPGLAAKAAGGPGALGSISGAAAAGATSALGTDLSSAAADEIQGRDHPLDIGDLASGMAGGALVGGALGAVGAGAEKVGGALTGAARRLRSDVGSPLGGDIRTLEAAGGRLGVMGPKPSPGMASAAEEAAQGGPEGVRFAKDVASERAGTGVAAGVARRAAELDTEWENAISSYKDSSAGNSTVTPSSTTEKLLQIISKRTHPGTDQKIPFASRGEFTRALNDAFEVTAPTSRPVMPPGVRGEVKTVAEAQSMGFDVKGNPADKVLLIPRKMTFERFDEMRKAIDGLAKLGDDTIMPREDYAQLTRSVREDRDKFPWPREWGEEPKGHADDGTPVKGLSAEFAKWHQKASEFESKLGAAGINKTRRMTAEELTPAAQRAAAAYGGQGQGPLTKALYDLAGGLPEGMVGPQTEAVSALKDVPAFDAQNRIQGASGLSPWLLSRQNLKGARVRLDPAMNAAASALAHGPQVASGVAAGALSSDAFKQLVMGLYGP